MAVARATAAGSLKGETSGNERINRYSSGMYVRLAFAVAADLEPEPRRWARRDRLPQAGPQGFANREERKPNFDCGRGLGGGRRGVPKKMPGQNEGCSRLWPHDSLYQPHNADCLKNPPIRSIHN